MLYDYWPDISPTYRRNICTTLMNIISVEIFFSRRNQHHCDFSVSFIAALCVLQCTEWINLMAVEIESFLEESDYDETVDKLTSYALIMANREQIHQTKSTTWPTCFNNSSDISHLY
jgi:hypothetical protein